ncbi:hypothetical protein BCU04_004110 [Vibrio cyclitrophicus]|uniref:Uncharacterized protein n=1 Tax=Vibrio cyclitrophicus TaxID=47951 RepID=A0ACD5FYV2_9VIBR
MMKNKLKSKRLDKTVAANRRKRMLSNNKKKNHLAQPCFHADDC